ncbi:MAG: hypothetical protein RMA76_09680 [Deltaproteobacteria bacterium]|jgi:hypothetical protein
MTSGVHRSGARPSIQTDAASNEAKAPRAPGAMVIEAPEPLPGALRIELPALLRRALKADVPQRRQQIDPESGAREGTCGLYALGMVFDFWHARDSKAAAPLVKDEDLKGPGVNFNHAPNTDERVFDYALSAGYSATGEIFTASHLGAIAEHFGYASKVHDGGDLDALYHILDAGHPALVCFDVDANGNPHVVVGDHAHWAVITGYVDFEGERYVVAKHGWDVAEHHVWRAEDFARSWRGLESTDYYGTPGDGASLPNGRPRPSRVELPSAGEGRADIAASVAGKIVEVFPPGEAPAATSR